jgi:hypothetical protein
MLWFRAWLETKWRVAFTIVWLSFFVGVLATAAANGGDVPGGVAVARLLNMLAFPCVFVPVWLAGSGVRTQPGFGRSAMRGIHGSTLFTLSLPVTRARLVLTRGALGLIATAGVLVMLGVATWMLFPPLRANATPIAGLQHLLVVFVCGLAFYGLSILTATVLDDVWHMWSSTLLILALWAPPVRRLLPSAVDVFRPLAESSPLVTHTLPWTAMAAAVVAGGVFVLAAVRVVQTQEY